jgi:hypothetical protein
MIVTKSPKGLASRPIASDLVLNSVTVCQVLEGSTLGTSTRYMLIKEEKRKERLFNFLEKEFKSFDLIGFGITVIFSRLNNGYWIKRMLPDGVTALTAFGQPNKTCFG